MSAWDDYFERENAAIAALLLRVTPPPTRADTIKECWRLYHDRFDYALGKMTFVHDLDIIEPIVFELIDYERVRVMEAEGVVVSRLPKLG